MERSVDAYVSIFQTTLGEGEGSLNVSLSEFGEAYVVPLGFSYVYLKSKIRLGDFAFTGTVPYYGESTFTFALHFGMAFGPITLCE